VRLDDRREASQLTLIVSPGLDYPGIGQPELCRSTMTFHVDVRWLTPIGRPESEGVPTFLVNRWHARSL